MVELTVAVPPRVAQDLIETIAWVCEHLDEDFTVDGAVAQAVLAWVADVRLEFINVGMECGLEGQRSDTGSPAAIGGVPS